MSVPTFDYYRILGLTKYATSEDVRRAYKQKVLETHPDKLPPDSTEEEKDAAREQFSKVHEASETLADPERRREYDIHYRELPDPSIKSASSPKSSTVSMSRSDSVSTVRTAGSRPANVARTPSMASSASTRSSKYNDSSSFVSRSRTSSMTSAQTTTTPAKALSRTNTVVTTPQSVAGATTIFPSDSASGIAPPVSRANSSASARQPQGTVSRANSSATARGAPISVSRSNSTATVRDAPTSVSRSNSSATARGAPASVSRNGSISSGHQLPSPLSRVPSISSSHEPPLPPSVSRSNSAATVRSSTSASKSIRPGQSVSRSNSTATNPPAAVSRPKSIAAVTAISIHETSSVVRSNSNATALTSVSARSKAMSNYSDRISMATVSSAFSDLPAPPYSHPQEYEALVEAMVQELYHLNPEWVERKQRLQEIKAQREAGNKIDPQLWRASWAS